MKNFTVLIKESFEIHKQKIKPILALATILITLEIILSSSLGYLLAMGENGGCSEHNRDFFSLFLFVYWNYALSDNLFYVYYFFFYNF